MKSQIFRKSFFIIIFFILALFWVGITPDNRQLANTGIDFFIIIAYIVTILWMAQSYFHIKDKYRYFWLFFAIGICFLTASQIITTYHHLHFGKSHMPRFSTEDWIRLGGYIFFFVGFVYQMKVIKNTLPMIRFLLNIIVVIVAVYSVSWHFIINPFLEGKREITQVGFFISSSYHVFNISLLFAAVCLIFISPSNQKKASLYLVAVGFFIQVLGDFFHITHVTLGGSWIFLLWPLSVLLMGLGASLSKEYHLYSNQAIEQLEYKNDYPPLIFAGILLLFTIYEQLHETNILQKGLFFTVLLLLIQQGITTFENKNIFNKLKGLASIDGVLGKSKGSSKINNSEMTGLLNKIEKLAHYDALTELPNRNLFHKCMEQEIKAAENNGTEFSLLCIDLDRFKNVNDSLGHDFGDLLLKQVANRLQEAVGKSVTVARIGGDEFAIIFPQSEVHLLEKAASDILDKFKSSFHINGHDVYTTPSIGISLYPSAGICTKDLLKSADVAMYLAKEEGKNKYKFFNPSLHDRMSRKIEIETSLRKGIDDGNFALFYQPQVDLRTEEIIGVEALIRLDDSLLGMMSPAEFIPVAEETGLIEPIGSWVIKTACYQMKEWQKKGWGRVSISVNVSIRQFQNPHFVSEVRNIIEETQLDPQFLKIEITESILSNMNRTVKILNELRELGIQIAIDDFGTGYSSLSYLKNLPVSCLKIDKAFIDELSLNGDGAIVKTIIDMGRNMNFTVIAEGVESKEHVSFLRENKCFLGQGYLFSKPLPALELEDLLKEKMLRAS